MSIDVALEGKRVLVTGGGRGLGAAVARRLGSAGCEVWIGYRENTLTAEATRTSILAAGGRAHLIAANLTDPQEIRRLAAGLERIDALVHAAALGSFKPTLGVRPSQWDLTLHTGSRALLLLARELADRLVAAGGTIVALSSLGSSRVVPTYGAIGIDKAALEATVRYLAVELGPRGVRANAVAAGAVAEGSLHLHPDGEAVLEQARRRAAGPVLTAGHVADAVLFLLSPLAAGIQGQTLVCDAGATLGL